MPNTKYHLAFAEEDHRHIKQDVDDVKFVKNLLSNFSLDVDKMELINLRNSKTWPVFEHLLPNRQNGRIPYEWLHPD